MIGPDGSGRAARRSFHESIPGYAVEARGEGAVHPRAGDGARHRPGRGRRVPMSDAAREGRFATLDGLRGLAVMGILLMNVVSFGLPEGAYFNPAAYGSRTGADYVAWGIDFVFADGKMRNLFSLLFGASMLLVVERARAAGESGAAVHYARMFWLLMFGAAHLYLVWYGDILTHYALVGAIAFLFVDRPTDALVRLGIACFVVQLAVGGMLMAGLYQLQLSATAPGAPAAVVRQWLDLRSEIGVPTAPALAVELARMRGGWGGIVRHLAVDQWSSPLFLLAIGGAETLGLMLLGMAGLKSGFLTGAWDRAAYVRVALWGYGIGVAGMLALMAVDVRSGFDSLTVFAADIAGATPFRPLVMAGNAAVGILWLTGGGGGFRPRVIAAGRAAFSNYLGTSLAMTALFYGWGFGLFGRIDRAMLVPVVLAAWGAMLLWSKPWLDRYRHGPLEWLWRSLARGRPQKMRRAIAS